MLLRMEKHFKSEQETRKHAEELLEQAVQAELSTKKELEGTLQRHSDEAQELELEKDSTRMVWLVQKIFRGLQRSVF